MIFYGRKIIGKYRLLREIGNGSAGNVYLAEDLVLGKRWAVKAVPAEKVHLAGGARLLAELDHPGIVRITDRLTEDGVVYTVMDHIEGTRLDRYREGREISVSEACFLAAQICGILEYLHSRPVPVIFRDLKPTNLILAEDGSLRLIDFDAAVRADEANGIMQGTRGYAAPEQFSGKSSEKSDLYAAGACLRFLMPSAIREAGQSLYGKEDWGEVQKICRKAMAEKPEDRYASAGEMKAALLAAVGQQPYKADPRPQTALRLTAVLLALILLLITRAGVSAAFQRQYRNIIAEGDYPAAVDLRPSEESNYLAILNKYEREGRTEEGIRLVRMLREEYPEETRQHTEVPMRIGLLDLTGSLYDPSFAADPKDAEAIFREIGAQDFETAAHAQWTFSDQVDWQETAKAVQMIGNGISEGSAETVIRKELWYAEFLLTYPEQLAPYLGDPVSDAGKALASAEHFLTGCPPEIRVIAEQKLESLKRSAETLKR